MDESIYKHIKFNIDKSVYSDISTSVLLGYILQAYKADNLTYEQTLELIRDLKYYRR